MKTITITLASLFLSALSFAQIGHDVEIYCLDGQKFTATMNGRLLSETPTDRIEVLNMNQDYVHLIIDFEQEGLENIEKKYFQISNVGSDPVQKEQPVVVAYEIIEKDGEYKLKFRSRSNKMIQTNTVIINQETQQSEGIQLSNGKVVINW